MDKSVEYIRGTKRLKIIDKYLRGIEDPLYDVWPTKKEGKYIVKRKEDKSNEEPTEDNKSNEKAIEGDKSNEEPAEDKVDEELTEDKAGNKVDENEEEEADETEYVSDEIEEAKHKFIPKRNRYNYDYLNDQPYIYFQILHQLQEINESMKKERERKEQKRLYKEIVEQTIKELNKMNDNEQNTNNVSREEIYNKPVEIKRRNTIFADVDF